MPTHVHGMILQCHEAANSSNVIQKDAFSFIQYKPLPDNSSKPTKVTPRKPSVIMFGIDSMSKINIRRTMPKVYKFLTQSGWFEMQGYNKVSFMPENFPRITYPLLFARLGCGQYFSKSDGGTHGLLG